MLDALQEEQLCRGQQGLEQGFDHAQAVFGGVLVELERNVEKVLDVAVQGVVHDAGGRDDDH